MTQNMRTGAMQAVHKRKRKPLTVEQQLANIMPAGVSVSPMEDGKVLLAINPTKAPDGFRSVGGCKTEAGNLTVLNQVMNALPQTSDHAEAGVRAAGAIDMMRAFEPKDAIEGMIAAQAVALHMLTMETARRAQIKGQHLEAASKLRRDTANMARAMTDMLAALDRKRGKGQQHIRVERVMVGEGGQAIVGNVTTPAALAQSGAAPVPMVELLAEPQGEGEHDG